MKLSACVTLSGRSSGGFCPQIMVNFQMFCFGIFDAVWIVVDVGNEG